MFSTQRSSRWLKKGYLTLIALSAAVLLTSSVIFLKTATWVGLDVRLENDVSDSNSVTTNNLKIEDANMSSRSPKEPIKISSSPSLKTPAPSKESNKVSSMTDSINAADTARRSNGAWISQGATHTATAQCLSLNFEEQMDAVIANSTQVFITMPPKAAGTSLKGFTKKCMKQETSDNFINIPNLSKNFLTDSFELPSIITSHLYSDQPLVDLAQQGTRQTLMIYMYRDETERLLSGIRQVLTHLCAKSRPKDVVVEANRTHCILSEAPVVELIENRVNEIGAGSSDILTCKAYEAIEQNAPNMIVVHYEQASKLQKLLAKHHCPELLEELPTKANVSKEKRLAVYLRLQKGGGDVVNLDEWLHKKSAVLEWSLKLKKHASCQAKTRHMEDDLFACSDQAIKVSSTDIKRW